MVSTLSWCLRGCALAVAMALLAGCGRLVVGTSQPVGAVGGETPPVPVAGLLIEPQRFPAQYPAAVLDGTAVYRALQDIDGVPAGSVVTPPDCAAAPLAPQDTAAAEGIDSRTASSLIVAVTRPAPPLNARADLLRRCPSFLAGRGEEISAVTVTLLPAPPVDADESYAIDQTIRSRSSASVRRTLTFVAQIGETRVSATWLHDGTSEDPDASSLDSLFSDAVLKVRRGG